jgi:hypothetical protein
MRPTDSGSRQAHAKIPTTPLGPFDAHPSPPGGLTTPSLNLAAFLTLGRLSSKKACPRTTHTRNRG